MIDLYYWPTPNGHKVTMFLEESDLAYCLVGVNIGAGEQFKPDFLKISPNNRMPAIVDQDPIDAGEPVSVFESGAILVYLADKTRRFLPTDLRARSAVLEWLFWQVSSLGPMAGQTSHFTRYAPEKIPYAIDRYVKETTRLYGVLDRQLRGRAFITGDEYSIADMATYPWIVTSSVQQQDLADFPDLKRWFDAVAERPATRRAYARADAFPASPIAKEEVRTAPFAQTTEPAKDR